MLSSQCPSIQKHLCIPHERVVRPPPQNSVKAKKLGGGSTVRKSPIGSTNNQRGMNPPLIKVSLYCLFLPLIIL
ncbi:hypothetical protein COI45_26405 [Bacillus wiedmannii]|nr:hypothetical protein COL61_08030 [Bacillus wiedmannii]PHF90209.1 hypothetical protein COI45_26405 [Bacillus wiedmannii]